MCRLAERHSAARRDDRLAVAQVKAEGDAAAVRARAQISSSASYERSVSSPTTTRAAPRVERVARALGGRHAGVEPQRRAECRHGGDERVLRSPALDRFKVRDVQLGHAKAIHVRARKRQRIAGLDGQAGDGLHRLVAVAASGTGVHSTSGEQVHDADYAHVERIGQ